MVKVYKPHDFVKEFDNIENAHLFIIDNNYQIYTIYCGGLDITVIEVF